MSNLNNHQSDDSPQQAHLNVDVYGIRGKIEPSEVPRVHSLREAFEKIKETLLNLCVDALSLPGEVLHTARAFLRGARQIPRAISRRIDESHAMADAREDQAQQFAMSGRPALQVTAGGGTVSQPSTSVLTAQFTKREAESPEVQAWIQRMRAKGAVVTVRDVGSDSVVLTVTRPGFEELAAALGQITAEESEKDVGPGADEPADDAGDLP